jgi:hypothetical protein
LFSLLTTLHVSAQEVLSAQGDSYTSPEASIDFTIGEVVVNIATDGANSLAQGFHQVNWLITSVEEHIAHFEASIYPNPTEAVLTIKTAKFEKISYFLYDAKGRVLEQNSLSASITAIDVSKLAAGSYSVVLCNATQKLKTFTVIKKD